MQALQIQAQMNEQQHFLSLLHHDNRQSYICRFQTGGKQYSSRILQDLEYYDIDRNTYVSINGFYTYGRKTEHIRQINAIYIDLDMHIHRRGKSEAIEAQQEYIDECVGNTLNVLDDAIYYFETFPEPTIITNTGRGLGLFFILERSIACSGINQKQVEHWKLISELIFKQLQKILVVDNNKLARNPEALLNPDPTVIKDVTRVVRMPLTFNKAAGRECRIERLGRSPKGEPRYYSLHELGSYFMKSIRKPTPRMVEPIRKDQGKIVSVDFTQGVFLKERMAALERLQKLRKGEGRNCREYMAFIYYNHAAQLYGSKEAAALLQEFNERFQDPLRDSELKALRKGVDTASQKSHEGYYKLTNKWIIQTCQITEKEQDETGIVISARDMKRLATKLANQEKRAQRNTSIVLHAAKHPELTYREIAILFGVSERTVKNVLKEAKTMRYKAQEDMQNEHSGNCTDEAVNVLHEANKEDARQIMKEKYHPEQVRDPEFIMPRKSAKKCPIVCCVPLGTGPPGRGILEHGQAKGTSPPRIPQINNVTSDERFA